MCERIVQDDVYRCHNHVIYKVRGAKLYYIQHVMGPEPQRLYAYFEGFEPGKIQYAEYKGDNLPCNGGKGRPLNAPV